MPSDPPVLAVVALAAAATALAALLVAVVVARRSARLQAAYDALVAEGPGASFPDAVGRQAVLVERLRADVERLSAELAGTRGDLGTALRHLAVVRYDAFADLGGRMSFSAALLDDGGDGLVLTSISGRTEARTYAKGVVGGSSEHPLSPEEAEAVARASGRPDRPLTPPQGRSLSAGRRGR